MVVRRGLGIFVHVIVYNNVMLHSDHAFPDLDKNDLLPLSLDDALKGILVREGAVVLS